jgi:glycosyltransferase involved in cell wall biosynthesis
MRLLMLSTDGEPCGIADYNSSLGAAFIRLGHLTEIVRIPRFDPAGLAEACEIFRRRLPEFDLGLVQHEWGFFGADFRQSAQCFTRLLKSLRNQTPVALFMHSSFPVLPPSRTFSFFSKNAKIRAAKRAMVSAINRRSRVFTHGDMARERLVSYGVQRDRIEAVVFPLTVERDVVKPRPLSAEDTVQLAIFGFVSDYKGYETVLNAMRLLPNNVTLVIAGGKHPSNPGERTLDSIFGFLHAGAWPRPTMPRLPGKFTAADRDRLRYRVRITGYLSQTEIVKILNSTDIALAIYSEGPPGSAALGQMLSLGRPVIASTITAFREVQRRGNCLKLIPPRAPFELRELILELIGDHPERLRLHESALAFARKHTFETLAQHIIKTMK